MLNYRAVPMVKHLTTSVRCFSKKHIDYSIINISIKVPSALVSQSLKILGDTLNFFIRGEESSVNLKVFGESFIPSSVENTLIGCDGDNSFEGEI